MMRTTFFLTTFAGLLLLGATVNADKEIRAEKETKRDTPQKVLRHVVLFQFKPETTDKQVEEITSAFAGLPGKIDAIVDFEWGTDVSVENKAGGFTHGFLVTFRDEKGRDAYLPHPAHQEFVKLVGPHVKKVLVFDYWAE